jgi:hypothetical protein
MSLNTVNKITNIGQVYEGQKVVAILDGVEVRDAKIHIGTGTAGKPRVWFCQNKVAGSDNSNPFGYRYAFSVGVESDGSLRLPPANNVRGLRAWTSADDLPETTLILSDGSRIAASDYAAPAAGARAPAGYRLERLTVVGAEENGVKFSDGVASAGLEFKTVAKFAQAVADREKAIAKYNANKARYNQLALQYGWSYVR